MAEISRDWEDKLDRDMRRSYLSVRVTQLVAGLMLLIGVITAITSLAKAESSAGAGMIFLAGVSLIISSVPIYLITQITEDIRKNRVASQSLLELKMQQSLYLAEVKTRLNESATYYERLLRLQTEQSRALNEIEALLAESTVSDENRIFGSEIADED